MYSPPPMDGFSPPPMSDFSPPPLSDLSPIRDFPPPMNGFPPDEDEDDLEDDFAMNDAQFDVTGLSDKLNSLEFDKISNLPPREILELKKQSTEVNSLFSPEVLVNNDINEEQVPPTVEDVQEKIIDDGNLDRNGVDSPVDSIHEEEPIDDVPASDCLAVNGNSEDCDNHNVDVEENVQFCQDYKDLPMKEPVSNEQVEEAKSLDVSDNEVEHHEEIENSEEQTQPSKHIEQVEVKDVCNFNEESNDDDNDIGDWSNFESTNNVPESDDWTIPTSENNVQNVQIESRGLEFDESDDDDDFGDFGEAEVKTVPDEPLPSTSSSILNSLESIANESDSLVSSLFESLVSSQNCDDFDSLELESIVMKDENIFERIEDPASCPALDYRWKDSSTYSLIMATLGIDSRILLDGESWRSSVPKYIPKNAATLMTPGLLTPEPAVTNDNSKDCQDVAGDKNSASDGVVPAQFDWNNSGLTNPLAENGVHLSLLDIEFFTNTTIDTKNRPQNIPKENSSPQKEDNNNVDVGAKILKDHMSREAQNILDGLPLLNFMNSTFLNKMKSSKS